MRTNNADSLESLRRSYGADKWKFPDSLAATVRQAWRSSVAFLPGVRALQASIVIVMVAYPLMQSTATTLLFDNLRKLGSSFPVDNPSATAVDSAEGPKGLAAADIDGDGLNDVVAANKDGSVTVLFGKSGGGFNSPIFLPAGSPDGDDILGLRDVITANVNGDARPEIIAARPYDGKLYIFSIGASGSRNFGPITTLNTWAGARAVVAGDFNGDGKTDLVVAGAGGGVREYVGGQNGIFQPQPFIAGIDPGPFSTASAKPVFTMSVWRPPGSNMDRVAVTFAETADETNAAKSVWLLGGTATTPLSVYSVVSLQTGEVVYDLAMGYLSPESRANGEPDLLTVGTGSSEVNIRRSVGGAGFSSYPAKPQQRLVVPAGPRALSIADVNGDPDKWPDLVVVGRKTNTLSLFLNNAGNLVLSSQTPTGSSPRDVVTADFDGNHLPDAAVISRYSEDVSLHRIDPLTGWFFQSPAAQRVPGGATAARIENLDGIGRKELIYLVPASGEVNIRQIDSTGNFSVPKTYFMGVRPQTLNVADLNGDGRLDLLCASLGDWRTSGGISYRLQLPDHSFGELITGTPAVNGAMLAELTIDLNRDGRLDRVTVATNSRIDFYEGTSTGLVLRRSEEFLYATKGLVAADLDGDGDLDLVGAGAYDAAVIENNGRWFTNGTIPIVKLIGAGPLEGAYSVSVDDINGDGILDLTVLSGDSVSRWYGHPGLQFTFDSSTPLTPTFDVTTLDFDGDGVKDNFALTPANTTATFSKGVRQNNAINFVESAIYGIPAVDQLISGDLDGDGLPDLVGAGEYLWVALSGTVSPPAVPTASTAFPVELPAIVINEVLASTDSFIPVGFSKPVDCVEIFNGTGVAANLSGWRLRRIPLPGQATTDDYLFPPITLQPRGFTTVYCTGNYKVGEAPFKLPEEGGMLQLLDSSNRVSDTVNYPEQRADISYARFFDGAKTFVYNPFPSIGSTNYDNGDPAPKVEFKGLDLELLAKKGIWRFRAKASSLNGILALSIHWRVISDPPSTDYETIPLYDDGRHDDDGDFDGHFAGDWTSPVPPGMGIEFYLRGKDLRRNSASDPDGALFTSTAPEGQNYTFGLPGSPAGWEISEVAQLNQSYLTEDGKAPDWVELRYKGPGAADASGVFLADSMFTKDPAKKFRVAGLAPSFIPGASKVVFLDDAPSGSNPARHAPFKVGGSGDSLFLFRELPSGVREFLDYVQVPALEPALPPDTSYARLGFGGPFVRTVATPETPNAPAGGAIYFAPDPDQGLQSIFAISGAGRVDVSSDLLSWSLALPVSLATSIERAYREPFLPQRFFRVR